MRYAESYRAPFPKLLVPFSGLVIVVAALALAAGAWADVAALVLAAFLLVVSYFMHPFWKEPRPADQARPAGPLPQEPRPRRRPADRGLRLRRARCRRPVGDRPAASVRFEHVQPGFRIVFGAGSFERLADELEPRRWLIVHGGSQAAAAQRLATQLARAHVRRGPPPRAGRAGRAGSGALRRAGRRRPDRRRRRVGDRARQGDRADRARADRRRADHVRGLGDDLRLRPHRRGPQAHRAATRRCGRAPSSTTPTWSAGCRPRSRGRAR